MPATVKVTLKAKPKADGTHSVLIRITKDRTPKYHTTGVYIAKSHWNKAATYEKKNWIKTGNGNHGQYNHRLDLDVGGFIALALITEHLSAEELITLFVDLKKKLQAVYVEPRQLTDLYRRLQEEPEEPEACFLQLFKREIERLEKAGQSRTARRRSSMYDKLHEYAGGRLPMSRLTHDYMLDYVTHLQTMKRPNAPETINKELQVFSGIAKLAMKRGDLPYAQNPFPMQVKGRGKKKVTLDREQLEAFLAVETKEDQRVMRNAQKVFHMQYLLFGARIGDVLELKWDGVKDTHVEYTMRKGSDGQLGNGKRMRVRRNAEIDKILELYPQSTPHGYVFPFLSHEDAKLPLAQLLERIESCTALINRNLKDLAKLAGIGANISTHVARKTFGNHANQELGDLYKVKELMGHESIRTTERNYMDSMRQEEFDAAAEVVYGKVKHG
ncbi:site-specific integrase [Rufibacter quisquiliarum]|uniref:Integrase n=1 Tax=Rufibacter quisquiliarum TaxID=1549639 RepID=A0A839GNU4_9BACT|nr:site-specific integrase [Rufibacter quisquiliarum]MBA9076108.1 integrase [Rufibacter quisquiliarum]